MKGKLIGQLMTFLFALQARGLDGIQALQPIVAEIVAAGSGPELRELLKQLTQMLDRAEASQ